MRLLRRSRERRSSSVQASTKARALWPFSTEEAEPDEASVGMRYPESLHPFAHNIQPILRAKREIRKEYGTVLGQQVLMTGQIGPRERQILRGEGGKWV
jgi:hypothetical protein